MTRPASGIKLGMSTFVIRGRFKRSQAGTPEEYTPVALVFERVLRTLSKNAINALDGLEESLKYKRTVTYGVVRMMTRPFQGRVFS